MTLPASPCFRPPRNRAGSRARMRRYKQVARRVGGPKTPRRGQDWAVSLAGPIRSQTAGRRDELMSKVGREGRSFLRIADADLRRIAAIAAADRAEFFQRRPGWATYKNRVLCSALCQGAALHFVNRREGINDFDVYTFYAEGPGQRWSARVRRSRDFQNPKFGKTTGRPNFTGRRVDLMGRSLQAKRRSDPVLTLHNYLRCGASRTARFLATKAVVILEPVRLRGTVVWPLATSRRLSNNAMEPTGAPKLTRARRGSSRER